MAKIKSRMITREVTFSIVAKVNEGINSEQLFKEGTEWLGEPKNADGCIMAMHFKSYTEKTSRDK